MRLKGEGSGPLPPLLQQYVELREAYPDYLLLFQVGDFYEAFGEDAERLARALGLTLTHKTSKDFTTPMAGIPVKSADAYIERLLDQGFRVAVADQVGDPRAAEGLVEREVTQLVTPGTVVEERLLKADANYLAAVASGDGYGLVLLDLSTGEFKGAVLHTRGGLLDELLRYRPSEVLLAPELYRNKAFTDELGARHPVMLGEAGFSLDDARERVQGHFGRLPQGLDHPGLLRAAGAALAYAHETQRGRLKQVRRFLRYDPGAYLQLDAVALATLEVFAPAMGGDEGKTLFGVLNRTRTAPGRRLLKEWLRRPLRDVALIEARLDAVAALVADGAERESIRKALFKVHDLERLASRLAAGRASPRDLAALARSLALVPELKARLARIRPLSLLAERMPELGEVRERIRATLVPDPPLKVTEGGMILEGADAELDRLRREAEEGRAWIAGLEARLREATGIPTLKVGFSGVFGYYLEVTRPYYDRVPSDWRPVQTLKDRQRYTRPDLKEKERAILRAEEAARRREQAVFQELREAVAVHFEAVRELALALAELDVYAALAEVAATAGYVRPRFSEDRVVLEEARHPVVEAWRPFIPNDLEMHPGQRLILLTGPNMSGKSTYLRQTALIALLAQIGSFVPAKRAVLPVFDRIFTRIGAADDLAGGRSTFMVEMEELAGILEGATRRSLVLLDEVGRGTSTYDGLAIAWASLERLHALGAYTLFATHYFELTALVDRLPGAANFHVAAREEAGGLVFYHQVLPGPSSKAYGLEVARMAGVPAEVVARAEAVLAGLEARGDERAAAILERLAGLDLNRLSPLDALLVLRELKDALLAADRVGS